MMKSLSITLGLAATLVSGHTIFQKVSVDGVDQGQLIGVRAPDSNYPIQDVTDPSFACNKNLTHLNDTIIPVEAGSNVSAWWGHVIGGPQVPNDPDNPIASSHKGPIQVYLAKVDDAATAGTADHKWFKVAEDGLNDTTGIWAVDTMIANNGWSNFTMPSCVAPGNYLMRVELLALHSAYAEGGAQFYMECAQIKVSGSGNSTGTNLVSFPGAYNATDPGILINIYNGTGVPNNSLKPYPIPGPPVITC
ncbi:glycoside hydrolase family 61 protein [Xylariaceae sp. FL0804]|nr:glycoside hydrolase family 61 protein [Xylariaceae sp. FL0804]